MPKFGHYFHLIKPGIVFSNTIATMAGFFVATHVAAPNAVSFLSVVLGTVLVIASACVVNNYMDRSIDAKMERTKKRELPSGIISVRAAIIYSSIMGLIGFLLLFFGTNLLTFFIGISAYIFYVVIYGYFKRHSEHGTLVGTISGALPPVAGYTAIAGRLDIGTLLLFAIMVTWQMAHFYAIAIFRRSDYAKAGIPLLSVTRGIQPAKEQIVIYTIAFLVVSINFFIAGYIGAIATAIMVGLGVWWLVLSVRLLKAKGETNEQKQARKFFGASLLVLLLMCATLAGGGYVF